MLFYLRSFFCLCLVGAIVSSFSAYAQDEVLPGNLLPGTVASDNQVVDEMVEPEPEVMPVEEAQPIEGAYIRTNSLSIGKDRFDVSTIPSSMLTYWEQSAIIEALNAEGFARPTTYSEILEGDEFIEERPKPPPEERYLSLGGIVYVSSKEWTVWLNGKRVTPEALPPEAIDLKVQKSYIEIKWFDDYTNQIFPIRLRPHQRFNIDTRIFLPG